MKVPTSSGADAAARPLRKLDLLLDATVFEGVVGLRSARAGQSPVDQQVVTTPSERRHRAVASHGAVCSDPALARRAM
eukprot:10615550-Ditylum_brightwellii.AAC.1